MTPSSDELDFARFDPSGTPAELLPLLPDAPVYRVEFRSAEAVVQPTPGELRIPSIRRTDRGDFRGLMDALMSEVNRPTVRFVGVQHPDDPEELADAWGVVRPDDARPLYEAVHGFDFDRIDYTHPDGTVEPCDTLVGEWDDDA